MSVLEKAQRCFNNGFEFDMFMEMIVMDNKCDTQSDDSIWQLAQWGTRERWIFKKFKNIQK